MLAPNVLRLPILAAGLLAGTAMAQTRSPELPRQAVMTGAAALADWRADRPGAWRRITVDDLPAPLATRSASNGPNVVERPDAKPQVPDGFRVELFAKGLDGPRLLRTAPNGDVFVAESRRGRIRLLRPDASGKLRETLMFATGLERPFGIGFYPPGPDPQWLYVANTNSIVRFPYQNGDREARGKPETVVAKLTPTASGHWTRDIVFSADGQRMFVSVGSASNVAEGLPKQPGRAAGESGALGAAWGSEEDRAAVLVFTPEGKERRLFATGLRNCVGMAVHPASNDLYCSVNERDGLGDDLVPDYVTRVREGAFYGWPWFYLGARPDPRHDGARPDLNERITVPDVLLQSHVASLQMTFYTGQMFPADYQGDAFAALHGSWNRAKRVGYKIVRIPVGDGLPTGDHQDFVTGFVEGDNAVWGRPVGITVARDGSLLFSDDGNGTIWRVFR